MTSKYYTRKAAYTVYIWTGTIIHVS